MEPMTLSLIAVSALGALAIGGPKPKVAPTPRPLRSYVLDANLPEQTRDQVAAALKTISDPAILESIAAEMEKRGYPKCAAALREKSQRFGGPPKGATAAQPPPAQPSPRDASPPVDAAPPASPGDSSAPSPAMPPPPPPPPGDAGVPAGVGDRPMPLAGPNAAAVPSAVSGAPITPVAYTPPPASSLPALDPGMPQEWQNAVWGALTTEYDPVHLRSFANEIKDHYPVAAGLLISKSLQLSQPAGAVAHPAPPATSAATAPTAAPMPSAAPAPPVAPMPTAAPLPVPVAAPVPSAPRPSPMPSTATSASRNAGRPQDYPYITLQGEETYPAKIAQQATGNQGNYPQLSAINPQFARDGVHWINIQAGDQINIPREWKSKLSALYHVTDPVDAALQPASTVASPTSFVPAPSQLTPTTSSPFTYGPPPAVPIPTQAPEPAHAPEQLTQTIAYHPSATPSSTPSATVPTTGGTYKVKAGDFPIKIAKAFTRNGDRWRELVAANPAKKTKADGNFTTLQPGEVLNLPPSWVSTTSAPPSGALASLGGANAPNA